MYNNDIRNMVKRVLFKTPLCRYTLIGNQIDDIYIYIIYIIYCTIRSFIIIAYYYYCYFRDYIILLYYYYIDTCLPICIMDLLIRCCAMRIPFGFIVLSLIINF